MNNSPVIPPDFIRSLSTELREPDWMQEFRLRCLEVYEEQEEPSGQIKTKDLPFLHKSLSVDRILPDEEERERRTHTVEKQKGVEHLQEKGVLFLPLHEALCTHPERVRRYFMRHAVPPGRSTFAALHGALWNGGTFVYVPENVTVDLPLTVYHQTPADTSSVFLHQLIVAEPGANVRFFEGCSTSDSSRTRTVLGCVEVIVRRHASVRYSTHQNWGKSTFNVSEKQAVVKREGHMEWVGGNTGSRMTEVIPSTVLEGTGASCRHVEFAFARENQRLCGGANVAHRSPKTQSHIEIRSASANGGEVVQLVDLSIERGSEGANAEVQCDELQLDSSSRSVSHQHLDVNEKDVHVQQEASTGPVSDRKKRYMRTRGITAEQSEEILLEAFMKPVFDAFPPEYAVELRKILMEWSGSDNEKTSRNTIEQDRTND